ncbi:putative protein YkoJ [Sporomusa carbonis]
MNKKWMAGVLSAMILGGAVAGGVNHPAFAAAPEAAKKVIAQQIDKEDQEQKDNDREVADSVEQANLAKEAKLTQQQSVDIAMKRVNGTVVKTELEDEDGVVVYDVTIKDSKGQVSEVKVDAKTGSIVKVEHDDDQNDNDTETNDDANG